MRRGSAEREQIRLRKDRLAIVFVDWVPESRYAPAVTFVPSDLMWTIVSDEGGANVLTPGLGEGGMAGRRPG